MFLSRFSALPLLTLGLAAGLFAQDKPGTDVLIFKDGEKLIGELKSATGEKVTFKSDVGFEVTVPWAKIQELHSDNKFAAIHKDLTLEDRAEEAKVPQGTLDMTDQKLAVTSAPQSPPQTIPVDQIGHVVQEKAYERAITRQKLTEGWKGQATFGLSLTRSTVNNQTYSTGVDFSRTDPPENWLRLRNRISFDFNSIYGKTTITGVPDTVISLYHSDIVDDIYFKPRWFAFVGTTFDHNFNQGLDLLQAYGGGIGRVVIKNEKSELDVRAGIGFMDQLYSVPGFSRKLVGSRFNESYTRTFAHGITLNEMAGIRPAWNSMKDYFTGFTVGINVPVYRRFSLSVNSFDSYANDPPPNFKKNSFQLTVGGALTFP